MTNNETRVASNAAKAPGASKAARCTRKVVTLMGLRRCSRKATKNGRCHAHQS